MDYGYQKIAIPGVYKVYSDRPNLVAEIPGIELAGKPIYLNISLETYTSNEIYSSTYSGEVLLLPGHVKYIYAYENDGSPVYDEKEFYAGMLLNMFSIAIIEADGGIGIVTHIEGMLG